MKNTVGYEHIIITVLISALAVGLVIVAWYAGNMEEEIVTVGDTNTVSNANIINTSTDEEANDEYAEYTRVNNKWEAVSYGEGGHSFSFEHPIDWEYEGYTARELGVLAKTSGRTSLEDNVLFGNATIRFFNNTVETFDGWISEHENLENMSNEGRLEITVAGQKAYMYDYSDKNEVFVFVPNNNYVYELRFYYSLGASSKYVTRESDPEAPSHLQMIAQRTTDSFVFTERVVIDPEDVLFSSDIDISNWNIYSDDVEGFSVSYPDDWIAIPVTYGRVSFRPASLRAFNDGLYAITVSVYGNSNSDLWTFYSQTEGVTNLFEETTPDTIVNNDFELLYFDSIFNGESSVLVYTQDRKVIEVQMRRDQLGNIENLQDFFYQIAVNMSLHKSNWERYENDTYGYRLENRGNKTMIVDDVYEGGTEGNPSFKIIGGGHFSISIHDNPNHLSIQEFFESNNHSAVRYSYDDLGIGGLSGQRVFNESVSECAIEWVAVTYGSKIFSSRLEACEDNRSTASWHFLHIMNSLRFTDNGYKIETLQAGDTVAGMTVEEINWQGKEEQLQEGQVPDGFSVQFSGTATLSGEYYYFDDTGMLGDEVCFGADNFTIINLPRSQVASSYPWLCFSNKEFAQQQFGPEGSEGEATIIIDDYYDIVAGMGGSLKAKLVEVIEKN